MMLYLCSHNNVNLFDWLNESGLVGQPLMLKKYHQINWTYAPLSKKEH
jgi:hypothetical protein